MASIVVCPMNGLPAAERALLNAFDVADHLGCGVELFSAVEDPHMVGRRQDYLRQLGAHDRPTGTPAPEIAVVVDPHAPRALAERSASGDATIVMATSTQPVIHTGYLGSAAERVARDAKNPVILIGPHCESRFREIDRVVAPCDGSALSEAILTSAAEWSKRLAVDLWVVTVLSPDATTKAGVGPATEPSYVRRIAIEAGAQWDVLHGTNPAKDITAWAGPRSLIAMTTHGRTGLSRITVGSIATGVARWATGPVLIGHPHNLG